MSFRRTAGQLHCEDVPLAELARLHGTPLYVYSRAEMMDRLAQYQAAFAGVPHLVAYSVKACSNLTILRQLVAAGAGCDVVSAGELTRARRAGCAPDRVVYSGVGKREDELEGAIAWDVKCINVESPAELEHVSQVAVRLGVQARIAFRVNPDVDARTHPYIATGLSSSKFGVPIAEAAALYARARRMPGIRIAGVACHIGSQMTSLAPLGDALARLVPLVEQLRAAGDALAHLDVGGGLGIIYGGEQDTPPTIADYGATVRRAVGQLGLELVCEPGRSIIGPAGALLTRVVLEKDQGARRFVVVDAAMTELIRPALYDAVHALEPVLDPPAGAPVETVDVVGPVCESGDILARDRQLPRLASGELLAIMGTGAYGMAMASTYNTRPRAAEVLVDGASARVVRRRETIDDLLRLEDP